jgi:hypothetical protein
MGDRTGTVDVYRGRVGDAAESLVATFASVSGSGFLPVSDQAPRGRDSYYRAYSTAPGFPETGIAYSNPVWVTPR